MYKLVIASAALVGTVAANQDWKHNGKDCHDVRIPVTVATTLEAFDYKPTNQEIDTTNFFLDFTRHGGTFVKSITTSKDAKINKEYTLAATICHPASGPGDTIQILTHGVGFDKSYWDYPYANYNYSYVDRALAAGYSTLAWDRLGIAASSHGDPVNEIQLPLEVEALRQLTLLVDQGKGICGLEGRHFSKKVHLGHSFGSAMTYSLTTLYPNITDGIVLTGFSQASNYMAEFALGANFVPVDKTGNPRLAAEYVTGYVANRDSIGVHIDFFGPGDFDEGILHSATHNGQPAALGELLTLSGGVSSPNPFPGPVLIITGDHDVPFCGGNCQNVQKGDGNAPNLLELSKPMFTKARTFNATIVPNAGHGLNFGFSHVITYPAILDFIKKEL